MILYAVLLDVMGSACFTVAVSEIIIHFRKRGRSYSLAFGVTSFFTAVYCIMCAGQYNVTYPEQSIFWLRMEGASLSLTALSFLWFIADATGMVPRRHMWAFFTWFVLCAAIQSIGFGDLTWIASRPDVKEVLLPAGMKIEYREVAAGPFTIIQSTSALLFFAYVFWVLIRHAKAGGKQARSLLIVVGIICAAILSDFAVSFDLYTFPYMSEYAWLAAILFVGFERSNQIIEAADAREALAESEEKFRTLIEQSSEAIILSDENGTVIEYNMAAEELSGITAADALGKQVWDLIHRLSSEDRPAAETRFRTMVALGTAMPREQRVEGVLRRPDGTVRYFRQNIFPIKTKKGYRVGTIVHDVTEARNSNDRLVASLQEKNVLLKELHHRVKNNLQVISSLLYMHESRAQDQKYKVIIQNCRHQILSMALIHEDLYRSHDFHTIDFSSYVKKLANKLVAAFGVDCGIALELLLEDISMSIEKAIPCGLILNELCINALKYAFPAGFNVRDPQLFIGLLALPDGMISLTVKDNGIGFPQNVDLQDVHSLGLQIVMTLVRQLQGNIRLEPDVGTKFILEFPSTDSSQER